MSRAANRYSQQAKRIFWLRLDAYRKALESGSGSDIVTMSLLVYSALSEVPKKWKTHVNRVFKETKRFVPLTDVVRL